MHSWIFDNLGQTVIRSLSYQVPGFSSAESERARLLLVRWNAIGKGHEIPLEFQLEGGQHRPSRSSHTLVILFRSGAARQSELNMCVPERSRHREISTWTEETTMPTVAEATRRQLLHQLFRAGT